MKQEDVDKIQEMLNTQIRIVKKFRNMGASITLLQDSFEEVTQSIDVMGRNIQTILTSLEESESIEEEPIEED